MRPYRPLAQRQWLRWKYSPLSLCAISFLFATQGSIVSVASPWRIMAMGGQSLAVGADFGLSVACYVMSCLLIRPRAADRFGAKGLTIVAALVNALLCVLMALAPSVPVLLTLRAAGGLAMGLFWPTLMGWVVAGREGKSLNRIMGLLNISWSSGSIAGSWLGGLLFAAGWQLPFLVATGGSLIVLAMLCAAHGRRGQASRGRPTGVETDSPAELRTFVRVSAVAVVAVNIAVVGGRAVAPVLIGDMVPSEAMGAQIAGMITAGAFALGAAGFVLLGRSAWWHYRMAPLLVLQFATAALLVGVGMSASPGVLAVFMLATTPVHTLTYSAHMYYRVSSGRHRAGSMALHETLCATGALVGALSGGAMATLIGIRNVYHVLAACLAAAAAVQCAMYARSRIIAARQGRDEAAGGRE